MKAIIDCGGWKGDSVSVLKKRFGNCIVHSFECVPDFFKYYKNVENNILHKKAVWIYDGEVTIYLQDNIEWDGHSLCIEKNVDPVIAVKHPITVPCIDFSEWILNNFKITDELYLKMNIEGSEYKVLDKMIKDGSIDYINYGIIHFHQPRYPEITTSCDHERILHEVGKRIKIETSG